jgi:urate oxidase
MLAETAYGKSSVRLVQVSRHGDRDDLKDFTVAIRFEGEYDQSFTDGDNRDVLPTDTMKNTVRAGRASSGRGRGVRAPLAEHFLERNPRLRRVRIDLTEHQWARIAVKAREHGQAFVRHGAPSRMRRRCRARAISSRSALE